MGRELLREKVETNGANVDRLDLSDDEPEAAGDPAPPTGRPAPSAAQLREAKRDRVLSHIAVLLLESTRALEPLLDVISARLMRWAALGASIALAFMAIRQAVEAWERLAVVGIFMLLVTLFLRKMP